MTNNNNTNERKEIMTQSLKEIITSYPEKVAFQMDRGLTTEAKQITEIGRVLHVLGNSRREINYYLNVDEDFISDVLGCYPSKVAPFDNFHPLNATKISPRWADGSKR